MTLITVSATVDEIIESMIDLGTAEDVTYTEPEPACANCGGSGYLPDCDQRAQCAVEKTCDGGCWSRCPECSSWKRPATAASAS